MNARKKCKKLKQRNDLLMHIVYKDPGMRMIYEAWTKPMNIVHSDIHFETYAARCSIEPMLGENALRFAQDHVARELFEGAKRHIEWRYDDKYDPRYGIVEGRLLIGRKDF